MFSPKLLEHFRAPRNVGELPPPAVAVEVTNPACGDILRLTAEIQDGRIIAVGYKVRGCTASIAAGSALTELILGKSLADLKAIKESDIDSALDGLPATSQHAASLCVDGVKGLLTKSLK